MCLTLLQNPKHNYAAMAADLSVGTWFIDDDRQIYVVVHNDRTEDPLIICLGDFYKPFVVHVPIQEFDVFEVLERGATLQITRTIEEGFING